MNLIECLTDKIGNHIAKNVIAENAELGILARRVYQDGGFGLIDKTGRKLIPQNEKSLVGYHLPGDRKTTKNKYESKVLSLKIDLWIFGYAGVSEEGMWKIAGAIEATKSVNTKQVEIEVLGYTNDTMKIIQQDFPAFRDQFQDKQTITTAIKYTYQVSILKCC